MSPKDAPKLGPHIQQIRKKRRLTLEQLAAASGVSRSMLSQIERGQANPTFATLWNLTRALGLEFSDLVGSTRTGPLPPIEVQKDHFTPEISTEDGLCVLRILSPASTAGAFEWYDLTISPGGALVSEPHARGSAEHLTVLEGQLEVRSGDGTVVVSAGGTARYRADVAHAIRNKTKKPARAFLVVALEILLPT